MNHVIEYIENNFNILNHVTRKRENIKLSDGQKHAIKTIENNKYTYIKKTRQVGTTTLLGAYVASKILMDEINCNIIILGAPEEINTSINLLNWIKEFIKCKPSNFHYNRDSEKFLKFKEYYCSVKSYSIKNIKFESDFILIIDEAWACNIDIEDFDFILKASKVIITSTKNLNLFEYANNFHKMKMHWATDEKYNEKLKWVKFENGKPVEIIKNEDYKFASICEKLMMDNLMPLPVWINNLKYNYGNIKDVYNEFETYPISQYAIRIGKMLKSA